MIEVMPYDDHAALQVFRNLDPHDLLEANIARGQVMSHLALFADWRAMRGVAVTSVIISTKGYPGFSDQPFAVLALGNTGQFGVAQAAFLSREHTRFAGPIARAGVEIRNRLPAACAELGIRRIEARCCERHPTAGLFLQSLGFKPETDMSGFGPTGDDVFWQFAFLHPDPFKPNTETKHV